MKTILLIVFGLILVVFVAGCTSSPASTTLAPTPTPEVIYITVTSTPIQNTPTTTAPSAPITTIISSPTATQAVYSSNDVNRHFVDIAFGPDYSYINKWNKELVGVTIDGSYTDDDVKILNDFFKLFNSYSSYTKLPSEVKQGEKGLIVIHFMPESSLKNINIDNSLKISKNHETGSINFIYNSMVGPYGASSTDHLYLNSDLKGDARKHWVLRSLLYELGFPGETGTYPDSIFYSDSDSITSLSKIDVKALELMYGTKISFGMSLNQVKQLLLLDNK